MWWRSRVELVANEVIYHPEDETTLNAFLDKYQGTVLLDGTPMVLPGESPADPPQSSGWYLIRVDPARSGLEDLAANMAAKGGSGQYSFSSEDTARLGALLARETVANLVYPLDWEEFAVLPLCIRSSPGHASRIDPSGFLRWQNYLRSGDQ